MPTFQKCWKALIDGKLTNISVLRPLGQEISQQITILKPELYLQAQSICSVYTELAPA